VTTAQAHRWLGTLATVLIGLSSAACVERSACAPLPPQPSATWTPEPSTGPTAASSNAAVPAVPLDLPRSGEVQAPPALRLPGASHGVEEIVSLVHVQVHVDGTLTLNGRKLANDEELVTEARRAHQADPNVRAIIFADQRASWSLVLGAMDLLKQAGIAKLAFGVEPRR
jgi:biopolymer transport protein ExbD